MKKHEWLIAIEDLMQQKKRPDWLDGHTVAVAWALSTWGGWYEPKPVYPSLEQIAARAGVSRQTAQRRVALLRKKGYLKQVQRGGRNLQTGESWATKYELVVPGGTRHWKPTPVAKVDLLAMHPQERFEWASRNCPPDEEVWPWLNKQMKERGHDA